MFRIALKNGNLYRMARQMCASVIQYRNDICNLQFGIWGGKMAAQRMLAAGRTQEEFALYSEQGRAFGLYEKVKPILEAHFEQ